MTRKTLLASVVLALLGISLAAWSAPVPGAKDKEAPGEELLSSNPMYVWAGESVSHVLEKPRVRSVGGRSFVVGKAVKDTNYVKEREGGKNVWVPLDQVREMIELEK